MHQVGGRNDILGVCPAPACPVSDQICDRERENRNNDIGSRYEKQRALFLSGILNPYARDGNVISYYLPAQRFTFKRSLRAGNFLWQFFSQQIPEKPRTIR